MLELSGVETTRRGITPYLEGQCVERVIVRERRLRWSIPEDLGARLSGRRIVSVERCVRYLLLGAEADTLISHPGVSGSLRLVESGTPASHHKHVDIELASGMALHYTDSWRPDAMLWSLVPLGHELPCNLGPEPLTDAFVGQCLFELSRGRSMAVKSPIMDNVVVVRVDSIYASEALFAVGIDPRKPAGSISKVRYLCLAEEIKQILATAVECGGTALRDFAGGDGQPGYFQQELFVCSRGGESCKVRGSTLREIRLGQRASVYYPCCQR